ncbi:alpha/beta fold hydrolase [Oceanicoccus sp. KOV_DT_Chl]|uniref:alpha/beta fold hydrolase n=1 Tax=Oceanicoccus sp. KOV_DT_Chl TaxID=1904639 RepID=UPI000C7B45DC|nr:alpha/beta fold hydrolase [Oceanicoccus sp. KOV_DT_Chl]
MKKLIVASLLSLALIVMSALHSNPGREPLGDAKVIAGAAGNVAYFVSGEGPVVVLLASYARSVSDFNELIVSLNAHSYQTVAIESRGVGQSALDFSSSSYKALASDIKAVLDAEQIEHPVHLIGHAFGNRIARTFATDYPHLSDRVVLLAAGGEAPTPEAVAKNIMLSLFNFWSLDQRQRTVESAFFADGNRAPEYWRDGWFPLAGIAQGKVTAMENNRGKQWLDGGDSELLVVQALADKPAPADVAGRAITKRLPERVSYVEIADAGHAMLPEQPELIANAIIQFLSAAKR